MATDTELSLRHENERLQAENVLLRRVINGEMKNDNTEEAARVMCGIVYPILGGLSPRAAILETRLCGFTEQAVRYGMWHAVDLGWLTLTNDRRLVPGNARPDR